jgi:DNA-directed RNA polymerase specialized sigma24 family protein
MPLPDENLGTPRSRATPDAVGFQEWKILLAVRSLFAHVNHATRNVFVAEAMVRDSPDMSKAGQDGRIANQLSVLAASRNVHSPAAKEFETDPARHRERLLREAVWLLGQMTPEERAVVLLRDKENLPIDAVARTLGWSKRTTCAHLATARIKLRVGLSRAS